MTLSFLCAASYLLENVRINPCAVSQQYLDIEWVWLAYMKVEDMARRGVG